MEEWQAWHGLGLMLYLRWSRQVVDCLECRDLREKEGTSVGDKAVVVVKRV